MYPECIPSAAEVERLEGLDHTDMFVRQAVTAVLKAAPEVRALVARAEALWRELGEVAGAFEPVRRLDAARLRLTDASGMLVHPPWARGAAFPAAWEAAVEALTRDAGAQLP
jgi:hypothetical protein